MLVQNEIVHVLNRSRAFVVITSGNHSIVVGIVGERVLLSLLSYCYLFVIVMPVSVACCRCYHVWHTLLPKDTFLVENFKKRSFQQKTALQLFNQHCTGWLTNGKGSMFHGPDVSCVREEYFWCFAFSKNRLSTVGSKMTRLLSADWLCWWSFHRMPSFGWLQSDLPEKLWVVV